MQSTVQNTTIMGIPVSILTKATRKIWDWLPWGRNQATLAPQPPVQATATNANANSNLNNSSSDVDPSIATTKTSSIPQHSNLEADLSGRFDTSIGSKEENETSILADTSLNDFQNQGTSNTGDKAQQSVIEVKEKADQSPVVQDNSLGISHNQQPSAIQPNIENAQAVSDKLRELEEKLKKAQETIEEQQKLTERFQQEAEIKLQQEKERHKREEERLIQEAEAKYKQERKNLEKKEKILRKKLKQDVETLKTEIHQSLQADVKQKQEANNQQLASDEIQERINAKEAFLKQLDDIVNDPKTVILEPENNTLEYREDAPFAEKQAYIKTLVSKHIPILGTLMLEAQKENDPFNINVAKLADRIGVSINNLRNLHLIIEEHNLDKEFGMASRRKRIINGSNLDSTSEANVSGKAENTAKDSEEVEVTFGGKTKSNQPVVLYFNIHDREHMLKKVVKRDIREFAAEIESANLGIVMTGTLPGTHDGTVYLAGKKLKPKTKG